MPRCIMCVERIAKTGAECHAVFIVLDTSHWPVANCCYVYMSQVQ